MKAENRKQFISVYNEEIGHVAMLWNSLPNEHNEELNDCIKRLKALVIIAADQAFPEQVNEMEDQEICSECGESVAPGSGRFVNRVQVLDDYETRVEMNKPYPEGAWLCAECDKAASAPSR